MWIFSLCTPYIRGSYSLYFSKVHAETQKDPQKKYYPYNFDGLKKHTKRSKGAGQKGSPDFFCNMQKKKES